MYLYHQTNILKKNKVYFSTYETNSFNFQMLKLQQLGCKGGMFLCVSPDSKKIMYSSDLEARNVFVAKESKDFRNMYLHTFKGKILFITFS